MATRDLLDIIDSGEIDGNIKHAVERDKGGGIVVSDIGPAGSVVINNVVGLTQAEYDAIATPDANTLYVITE